MLLNATTAFPESEVEASNGPLGFGWGINLDSNIEEENQNCLVFENFPKNKMDEKCWTNPANCERGFSLSIWEKITFRGDDATERFVVSTGGDADGTPGVTISFRGIFVNAVVSTGEESWSITAPGPVPNNTWSQIGIRWLKETGLEMYVDANMVAYMQYPDPAPSPSPPLSPLHITVGCHRKADGSFIGFAYGEFDELTGWMWALEPEQLGFFTGGYDNATNCDPEIHDLHCETNPQKLLAMMEDVVFEDANSLLSALEHLEKISQVEKDPAGSATEEDGSKKNNGDLEALVSIVEKLIEKTTKQPAGLTVDELSKLMVVADIVSNLFSEQFHEGWGMMQENGKTSIEFGQAVEDYMLTKALQTNIGKEPMSIPHETENIVIGLQKIMLYDLLEASDSVEYPSGESASNARKKREIVEDVGDKDGTETTTEVVKAAETDDDEEKVKLQLPSKMFGDTAKTEKVCIETAHYRNLDKIAPLWNSKTGNDTWLIFIDSEVLSVKTEPAASPTVLGKEPAMVVLKHHRKEKASGRKLLLLAEETEDLKQTGEIRNRHCVRWDKDLELKGIERKGGWSPDGCTVHNSTAEETICQCKQLGTYAIMSKIRQPFDIPPEEEWLRICKLACFGISAVLLLFYKFVIVFRTLLHEQFHVIRLNLAVAALGASVSFCLSSYMNEDEEICRMISMAIHFFYTAVGTWLTSEAHAIFSALVTGSFGNKFTCYVMLGWIAPGCLLGGCLTLFPNYGYDYRCLVGYTAGMRWLLVTPIIISAIVAFTFSILTCINYGTPSVKKTAIVNELSTATRMNFVVILIFLITWCCGVFALVDLGFDSGEIPAFNPIFQILNACLGIFIVVLIGFGSRLFRYSLCHSKKTKNRAKNLHLDPFEIHDNAHLEHKKKIYAA